MTRLFNCFQIEKTSTVCIVLLLTSMVVMHVNSQFTDNLGDATEIPSETFIETQANDKEDEEPNGNKVYFYTDCNDIPNEDNFFCYEFKNNDFKQVFVLSVILFLIHSGTYLMQYSTYVQYVNALISTSQQGPGVTEFFGNFSGNIDLESFVSENNFGGLNSNVYIIGNTIVIIIYFIAKVILMTNDDIHLDTINKEYKDVSWRNFVTAENLIYLWLLSHTAQTFESVRAVHKFSLMNNTGLIRYLTGFCVFLCFADAVASFVFICIKWSLLLLSLYGGAISLLVGCMLICTICIIAPIIGLWVICFAKSFAKICTCYCSNSESTYAKTMFQVGTGIAFIPVSYLTCCLVLLFSFLILNEDGPPSSIIYLDESDNDAMLVFWLCVAATATGFFFFIIGIFSSICCERGYSKA